MTLEEIQKNYFSTNTRGYKILHNYYIKYNDLFVKTIHPDFNDFLNQILLNVSKIKFSEDIKNVEAYLIGTIKIQCRVQLDKAIKFKDRIKIVALDTNNEDEEFESPLNNIPANDAGPDTQSEAQDVFNSVQKFKNTLKESEVNLLNALIDEIPRTDLCDKLEININTLDTKIRRLRIKFVYYLKESGHKFKVFEKYEK